MKKQSFATKLLKKFTMSRYGMTVGEAYKQVEDVYENTSRVLHIYLARMVKSGMLRTDGKKECPECGSHHVVYRITDEGRIMVARNDV